MEYTGEPDVDILLVGRGLLQEWAQKNDVSDFYTRSKKLLVAPGITTWNKKLQGTKGIVTRSRKHFVVHFFDLEAVFMVAFQDSWFQSVVDAAPETL